MDNLKIFFSTFVSLFILFTLVPQSSAQYRLGERKPEKIQKKKNKNKEKWPEFTPSKKDDESGRKSSKEKNLTNFISPGNKEKIVYEGKSLELLASEFDVPFIQLKYLRNIKHGYRELINGLIVSRESQAELGRVLNLRVEGKSWKDIANDFFVSYIELKKDSEITLKKYEAMLPKDLIDQRPEIRGNDN